MPALLASLVPTLSRSLFWTVQTNDALIVNCLLTQKAGHASDSFSLFTIGDGF
jgi:hypothetical protein